MNWILVCFAGFRSDLLPLLYRWSWFCVLRGPTLPAPAEWYLWRRKTSKHLFPRSSLALRLKLNSINIMCVMLVHFHHLLAGCSEAHDFVLQGCCWGTFANYSIIDVPAIHEKLVSLFWNKLCFIVRTLILVFGHFHFLKKRWSIFCAKLVKGS